eukprot:CAMPEP_0118955430 /NCGR_PEP_ID=MMETSP1169-20130426/59954_1 /TAXON_ID=36882 /ORGANISM="Pyramimonas obovata, Strain CCMP722" /LENGTH=197 /DNA_ID=CAMNT_0006903275 /DNA_START=194 /DNA_END=784 /DNA_ORIENTATION=-
MSRGIIGDILDDDDDNSDFEDTPRAPARKERFDEQEYGGAQDGDYSQREEQHEGALVLHTTANRRKVSRRYFILKSLNHQNIASAIEHGVWATQKQNERKLNEAYYSAEAVYLIFSVNMSHHFQGYARMISPIGHRGSSMWEGDVSIGGQFRVAWQCLYDLSFNQTLHIRNPLNEDKPVKISRDGQELTQEVGDALS